jgi:very-short-patch-repair endonuclease
VEALEALGGVATRAALVGATSRRAVDRALREGEVVAVGRGRYALPSVADAPRLAHGLGGVLSLTSAALHHGWEVARPPVRPHVLVPRHRRASAASCPEVVLHRGDLLPEDVVDGTATSVELTLLQCGRSLPFDEALAVVDSALRHGVPPATLRRVALTVAGPGTPQVRRLAAVGDDRAANPFESVLRAIALGVPGLHVRPQVRIATQPPARVDLADEDLGIVLEADSFAWHGDRAALRSDARRYDLLVAAGWIVLRFAWEDVMHDQDFVRQVLVSSVAVARGRSHVA